MKGDRKYNRNAATHGVFARVLLKNNPFGEDREDFIQLVSMLRESIRPVGGLEETLVEKLGVLFFRLLRLYRADLKTAPKLFARVSELLGPGQPAVKTRWVSPDDQLVVVQRDPTSESLTRYEGGLEKQIGKTLDQIESLQRIRREFSTPAPSKVEPEAPDA